MNHKGFGFALFIFVLFASNLFSQTTWTGSASSNWNLPANWSNGVPGPFNEPTIPNAPAGQFFPIVTIFTYFDFNVQNLGTITIEGTGGVTLFGAFTNQATGKLVLANADANFLVESTGNLENRGIVMNKGTFNNEGNFVNGINGVFENNHIFSHTSGSFLNQGKYNNFAQFFSESSFQNNGEFNNHSLFNNNDSASNAGVINTFIGSILRNDLNLQNQGSGIININGTMLNNNIFQNQGQLATTSTAVANNSFLIRNLVGGSWNNSGMVHNVFCAVYENKGAQINTGVFENEGIVYADNPIAPQLPVNTGSGVVITPTNSGNLCHGQTIELAANNNATVTGLDLANDQLNFCTNWSILVNGQSSFSFVGCASLGNHIVSVAFTDPFGRTTTCNATVTVVDNLAPIIACQPTLIVQPSGTQCTAVPNLVPPTVLIENCTVAIIYNDAPSVFAIGTTPVNWVVSDQNGNSSTCSQNIIVVDQASPTITCPQNKTFNTSNGVCGLSGQDPAILSDPAFAFDNCGTPTVTNNAAAVIPIGTSTLTWTATDGFGNTSSCPQQITVVDLLPPMIVSCPPDITVQPSPVLGCQAVVSWGNAVVTDNCGTPTQIFSISSGSVFDAGVTQVTVLVSDASLNTASCQFNVTVQDSQPPIWSNCPADNTITLLDCGDVAIGTWTAPTATDACMGPVSSNFQPGDQFPVGPNLVIYTATDLGGNSSNCSFTINVVAQLALDCPSNIVVNLAPGETASTVNWNPPPGATNCSFCASVNLPGFMFLGEKTGHRYYVYLGGQVTWADAQSIAAQYGGYLAAIADATENELLRKEFPGIFQSAWIGLNDEAAEGQFAWANGEVAGFSNWANGSLPQNDQLDFAVLKQDGFWFDDSATAMHPFILEIPCYATDLMSSNAAALSNMVFPLGNTTISYEVTDNCGNTCACDFEVQVVQNQQVAPCVSAGNSEYGWIENVQTEGFDNPSGDDGGRGNYTNSVFQLPDPGCILKLTPGGPATDNYLYWRIWVDLNMDGDFFDDNEVLASLEGVGEQEFCYDVVANLPTGPVGMRIAMSRWDYAAACGSFLAGEAEDYTVDFVDSSLFNPDNCAWNFALLDGAVGDLNVKLKWQGNGNCDVVKFLVERSPNDFQYEIAAEVLPIANGQLPILYEYEDKTPYYGQNYYRIKAVMEDGTVFVSAVFDTEFQVNLDNVFLYPNPASTETILHVFPYNGLPGRIFIADIEGRLVFDEFFDVLGNEAIRFDLANYPPGVYTLYLKADEEREQVLRFLVSQY